MLLVSQLFLLQVLLPGWVRQMRKEQELFPRLVVHRGQVQLVPQGTLLDQPVEWLQEQAQPVQSVRRQMRRPRVPQELVRPQELGQQFSARLVVQSERAQLPVKVVQQMHRQAQLPVKVSQSALALPTI